ncbi:MAG: MFS transporter [Pseudomonadota bacterium]
MMIRPGWTHSSAFYFFLFLALGAHLPFWPLWLSDWGLSAAEVGTYTALAVAIRVLMGVALPWAADRAGTPRRALALLGGIAVLGAASHALVDHRAPLLIATLVTAAAVAGIGPIADALTLRAADRSGFAFATARSTGSAAFLIANIFCGIAVAHYGSDAALWWIVVSFVPLAWLGLRHPGGAGIPLPQPRFREAGALLCKPAFILTMIASASLQGAHAVLYTYGSIHWRTQGIDDQTIGGLWAIGVLLEVILMLVAGKWLIERLSPAGAMALAGGVGLIRWVCMTGDPGEIWLWPLQALHAITFTAAFLGAIAQVARISPVSLGATAQGMVGAMAGGLVMASASFAAAFAYPQFGAGAYWISVGLSLTGLLAALALKRVGS